MGGQNSSKALKRAICLTGMFFIVEAAGGWLSGSLSLFGDAAHMLEDTASLLLSLGALMVARRLPTPTRTFGYHRVEIGAAAVNGLLLIGVSIVIAWEAVRRFSEPRSVDSALMLAIAVIGLCANIAAAYLLHGSHDLNMRSAFLHVLGDTLSSVAVILAAIWIALTGQTLIDPLLGLMISIVILLSAISVLRETVAVLLQFAPHNIDTDEVIRDMESVIGVAGVHNLHLWSLCGNINVLDAHVYSCETDARNIEAIKREIKQRLLKFRILHSTLEFEWSCCSDCRPVRELNDS